MKEIKELKKFILAYNEKIDNYMILSYVSTGYIFGYFNIFNGSQSVIFSRGDKKAWDILKTADTLEELIVGCMLKVR